MSTLTPLQKAKKQKYLKSLETRINKKKREVKALNNFYKKRLSVAVNKIVRIKKRQLKKGK